MRRRPCCAGLIAAEVSPAVLRHILLTAITDHFLAYGHSMIFVQKAFEMLDQIGWQEADTVLSPLVPEMVLGYEVRQAAVHAQVPASVGARRSPTWTGWPPAPTAGVFDAAGYRRALTDGSPEEALRRCSCPAGRGAGASGDRRDRPRGS